METNPKRRGSADLQSACGGQEIAAQSREDSREQSKTKRVKYGKAIHVKAWLQSLWKIYPAILYV